MNQNCIRYSSIELLQALGAYKELKVLLPKQLVLLELATTSIVQVHNAALNAVVMTEIPLNILGDNLLSLGLDRVQLSFILDSVKKEIDRGVLSLKLVLVVAPRFHYLAYLVYRENAFVPIP